MGIGPGRCALVVDAAVAVDAAAAAAVVVVVVAVVVVVVVFGPVGVQCSPVRGRALLLGYCRPSRYVLCPVLGMCVHPMCKGLLRGRGCGCYRWPCVGNGRLLTHRRSHPPLSFRPLGVLAATTVSLNGRPIAVTAASVAPSATSRIPLLQELIVRDAGPFLVPGVNVVTVEVWAAVSRVSSLFDLRMDLVSLRRVWFRRPSTPRLPCAHFFTWCG